MIEKFVKRQKERMREKNCVDVDIMLFPHHSTNNEKKGPLSADSY